MSSLSIDRDKTALIVVDMQRAFLRDDGECAKLGFDMTYVRKTVEPVRDVIQACRQANVPVIFVRYVLRPDYEDAGLMGTRFAPLKEMKALAIGSWGAEIDERLNPQPTDFYVDKCRFSAFFHTNMDTVLRGLDVNTVIVCGVTTEICVDSTVRDAFARDYNVIVVNDAVAAFDNERHKSALQIAEFGFATLCSVDELQQALSTPTRT